MIEDITPTVQQNHHRLLPPALRATVEPAINDIVLRGATRTRRGKAKMSGIAGNEFHPRWLAFGGNEAWPFQEFERFLQPWFWCGGGRRQQRQHLNG